MPDTASDLPLHAALTEALRSQFRAALITLARAVDAAEGELWTEPVAVRPCWEAALHVTYFAHLYLTPAGEPHPPLPEWVRPDALSFGYSWDPPYVPVDTGAPPERERVRAWIDGAIEKVDRVLPRETPEALLGPSGFEWRKIPRVEMHLYHLRHIQHHAAQIVAMLRRHGREVEWVGTDG